MQNQTNTTNTQPTIRGIHTEAEAEALVRRVAEANPGAVRRDLDALLEVGEADYETALSGYLWDAVEDEVPEMDEDTLDLLADAVFAYYEEQMDAVDEYEACED